MKKLLWLGDAGVASGFERVTRNVCDVLRETYQVSVAGINYYGDPHDYPFDVYPVDKGGCQMGTRRLPELLGKIRPDICVIQNDPWNYPEYFRQIRLAVEKGELSKSATDIPFVGMVAVDGKNCRGKCLNDLSLAVFWTKFAQQEAYAGGYENPSAVVPLGVDLEQYAPIDRSFARSLVGIPDEAKNAFIIGCVNRNQPRKRLDLLIDYFAEWVRTRDVRDAYLFLHVAPTGDRGYGLEQLVDYFFRVPRNCGPWTHGKRVITSNPPMGKGIPETELAILYNCFDAMATTTQGEGWGLPHLEGMACGVPQILPRWSALGDWARGAAYFVDCPTTIATPGYINSIGGIADREQMIEAFDQMYREPELRSICRRDGLALANRPEYRWRVIGEKFRDALDEVWAGLPAKEMVAV